MGLSQQLSDSQQQLTQLAAALEQARAHLQAQQQALSQARLEGQAWGLCTLQRHGFFAASGCRAGLHCTAGDTTD